MFLDFMDSNEGKKISKLAKESCTYNAGYNYWRDNLFERIMRLFVWDTGDPDNKKFYVPPKEIEQRLLLAGHCGITKVNSELTAMYGSFYGVTKYQDEKTNYNVHCPIYSGSKTIDKDIVVVDNNSLRNPAYPLVHRYATMLSHAETTLIDLMVNARDSGGVPVAHTEKQKQSISEYQSKIFNGQYGVVTDIGNLGIDYAGTNRNTSQSLSEVYEIRQKLIKSFYSDIGVRSAFEKRSNTITEEVEADTSMLLLNLSDMIKSREMAVEKINKLFGVNWSVRLAEEINYSEENEVEESEVEEDV